MRAAEITGGHYLSVLRTVAETVASAATPPERLAQLVRHVAEELRWDVCSIYLCENGCSALVMAATHGLDPRSVGSLRLPVSEGLVGAAARDQESVFVTDAQNDPRFRYFPETGEEHFKSMAAVPMFRGGNVIGVLTVQTRESYEFTTADRHFLELLAAQIAQTVDLTMALRTVREGGRTFHGVGVSPGFAEARVHRFKTSPDTITIAARGFKGVEFEKDLFHRSRHMAIAQLDRLIDEMKRDSPAAAQIFGAHKMILEDPELAKRILGDIEKRRESAPRAVAFFMDEQIAKFAALSNPLLAEKAQDLRDLRDMLLSLMMDEKITHFAPEFEEEKMIVVAKELSPQEVLRLDATKVIGLVTEEGSELSHVAILARAMKFPAVVGALGVIDALKPEDRVLVDGDSGYVFVNPDPAIVNGYREKSAESERRHAELEDELNRLIAHASEQIAELDANIGLPFEIKESIDRGIFSVGLFRTEFFYMQQRSWPDEDVQAEFYRRLLAAFPVDNVITIRLLDIGGDKFLGYMPDLNESNPHLGYRSIRLLLDRPELLRSQLAAIHSAAQDSGHTPRILVPMVTHVWELDAVRETLLDVTGGTNYPIGIMVEVPSTLFQIEELAAGADFISVGTNDLAQYLLAVDRNNARVMHLAHPLHPALLRALSHLFVKLSQVGKPFSVCGEMAGSPLTALALLVIGYRRLTIAPTRAVEMHYLLRSIPGEFLISMREPLLQINDAAITEKILRLALKEHAPLL